MRRRYRLTNFSFFDQKTIQQELEQMAAQGWMLQKAGSLFWTYESIPPQPLRFAVTYFPGASELDPSPSEGQLSKEDLCAQDGWRLVLRWDAMQIFCTSRADAVPIETDPVPQVANIHRTMKKKLLSSHLLLIVSLLWFFFLEWSQLNRNPAHYLSQSSRLFSIPMWLILLFGELFQIGSYFRWHSRAQKAAEDGIFLPVQTHKRLSWCIAAAAAVFLVLVLVNSNTRLLFLFLFTLFIAATQILGRWLMNWLKKKGLPRQLNFIISCICLTLFLLACVAGIVTAGITGLLPIRTGNHPVDHYTINGHTFDIYDDPLPLEVETLLPINARWSKKADLQESFLVSYGVYRQDLLFTEDLGNYDLRYEITDVTIPVLYDFLKERLLQSHQDEIQEDFVFTDHYVPVDPTPWGAEEAYQLHWSGSILDTYLVCWEDRIVEIKFYWEPTAAQIQAAAARLSPAE